MLSGKNGGVRGDDVERLLQHILQMSAPEAFVDTHPVALPQIVLHLFHGNCD